MTGGKACRGLHLFPWRATHADSRAITRRRPAGRTWACRPHTMESNTWTPFIGACILTSAIVLPQAPLRSVALGIAPAALVTAARSS